MSSIKKNLAYNFLLSASQVFLPLVSIPYVSRILTPEGVGRVSFMDSFTYYFISIAEFGIVVYGMREIARVKDDTLRRAKLVSELLALHVIASMMALVLYSITVVIMWNKIQDIRLLLFSLSYLLVNFFACEWYFLGMERFRYLTFRSLATRVAGLISIFLLIKAPEDYYIYYGIIVASAIVNSIWNNYHLFRELPLRFKGVNWKQHIVNTRITWSISLVYGVTLMLDNVLLRLVSTAVAVGYYAFSMKIVRTAGILLTDSLLVFFPRIVALLKEGNTEQVQLVVRRNLQLMVFFAVPLSTGLFLLAEPLIVVCLGPQFLPAVTDLRILAFFPFLKMYNLFISKQVLIAHDKEKLYLQSLITGSILFVIFSLVFSSLWSHQGACIAMMLAEIATLLLNGYYARRTAAYLAIVDGKALLQSLAGIALFIPIIYFIEQMVQSPLVVLLSSIATCFIVYMLIQGFIFRNELMLVISRTISRYLFRNESVQKSQ